MKFIPTTITLRDLIYYFYDTKLKIRIWTKSRIDIISTPEDLKSNDCMYMRCVIDGINVGDHFVTVYINDID